MKSFDIPVFYRSPIIGRIKNIRKDSDPKKKDFTPSLLDFGPVRFLIARHFGFCFGVENAIEISYRAIEENPGKNIYLLSQMIHNPNVNKDLEERGLKFIQDTYGNQLISWDQISKDDIVITPAFGTTTEIEELLQEKGIKTSTYDTTCPFVTRVWKKAEKLGKDEFTVIIHGKSKHEETRATFSHSYANAPSIIVKDLAESELLASFITGVKPLEDFMKHFSNQCSKGFDPSKDLERIGVVNQTTMLATETQEIADFFKSKMEEKFGSEVLSNHFADTRDTLCYATNDNQGATYGLLEKDADLAIIVGGYNSSNTTHLVELCEEKVQSYFINGADQLLSPNAIQHFDIHNKELKQSGNYLGDKNPTTIILTSGASCPDAAVDEVLQKVLGYFENTKDVEEVLTELENKG
jgi:4-hydroxy-3-methylbut-2-enyl diphosphate reductase